MTSRPLIRRHVPSRVPPIVHEVLRSPGQSLDDNTRTFMESRLGHDFSKVRVHIDSRAADSARAVNALAYAVGREVIFGAGRYAPHTGAGKRLLAHELTHVVQQRTATADAGSLSIASAQGPEREADQIAETIISSQRPPKTLLDATSQTTLARKAGNPAEEKNFMPGQTPPLAAKKA